MGGISVAIVPWRIKGTATIGYKSVSNNQVSGDRGGDASLNSAHLDSAHLDRAHLDRAKRRLLKGAAAAPLVVSFYGGRAWAVSSCGQQRIENNDDLDSLADILDNPADNPDEAAALEAQGIGASCLVSAGLNTTSRLDDLTRPLV